MATLPTISDKTGGDLVSSAEHNSLVDAIVSGDVSIKTKSCVIVGYATDPTPDEGEIWYNTTSNELKYYDGTDTHILTELSASAVKTLYESNPDTNAFTDAEQSKLTGIESGATADQSDAEIKTAYENNANTNAFTDAEQSKLTGIESGATADQNAADIRGLGFFDTTNDGAGSGLDADTVDGTELAAIQIRSEKAVANGYASLDGGGKVPVSQLPSSLMEYLGVWNASTNSPTLSDGTGEQGNVYRVSVAGSQNLGSGSISYDVGDYAIHNGSVWEKSDTTDAVATVAGKTGNVTLDMDDLSETGTGKIFSNTERTKLAGIEAGATADQSNAEIKTAYEANANTNEFSDAEQSKLAGIESGATADQTASELLTAIKTVDGAGSGLDADTVDGVDSSQFLRSDTGSTLSNSVLQVLNDAGDVISNGGTANTIQFYQLTAEKDAFLTFHVGGDTAVHFGLDGTTNDLAVGGWSFGAVKHRIWHAGNDGAGSLLDSDLLDGQHGSYYQNASNLNSGTVPSARMTGQYNNIERYPSIITSAGNRTLTSGDFGEFIHCTGAGSHVITLPENFASGFHCVIALTGTGSFTLDPQGADTLNGSASSIAVTTQYQVSTIWSDGSNWYASGV